MTGPRQIAVVTDYDTFQVAIRARVKEMQITRQQLDDRCDFTIGQSQKLLSAYPTRAFGRRTLGPALKELGLAIAIIEVKALTDLECGGPPRGGQPASGKSGLGNLPEVRALTRQEVRKLMRKLARKGARKGGLARAAALSPAHRRRIARKAGQASARKAAAIRAAKQVAQPDACHNPVKPSDATVAPA